VTAPPRTSPPHPSRTDELRPELRPRLRGVSHQWAFVLSIPAGVALVVAADTLHARLAVGVYALSVAALFASSALYHRITWASPDARRRMRRVDHSAIFVLIAGTYTPFALLAVGGMLGAAVLTGVWAGALAGIAVRVAWSDAPRWATTGPYVVLGWVGVAGLPVLWDALGPVGLVLLLAGGVLYTLGAVTYARRRPDPVPSVFGYHEVFHALVVGAVALHYACVAYWAVR